MRRAFSLLEFVIVAAVVLFIGAILFPILSRNRGIPRSVGCIGNVKQIGLGIGQYIQDYNERLPLARVTASTGWMDALQPYLKSEWIFMCPSAAGPYPKVRSRRISGYFYNCNLRHVSMKAIVNPRTTIMIGDGEIGPSWNAWAQLPPDAVTNSNSASQRHQYGAYYCFADGHAKWLLPSEVANTLIKPGEKGATFVVR